MADTRRWALAGYLSAQPAYEHQHPETLLPLADGVLDYLGELDPLDQGPQNEPLLGLATTAELLEELIARFEVDRDEHLAELVRSVRDECDGEVLAYRTVDG